MGMLDSILSQVLNSKDNGGLVSDIGKVVTDVLNAQNTPAPDTPAPDTPTPAPDTTTPDEKTTTTDQTTTDAPDTPTPAPSHTVDVAAVLDGLRDQSGEDLDWRNSIVDLLKVLGHDSSLSSRKDLAGELNYTGDTDDSASMNIWLHKQIMTKLAENGGKLPDDL